VAPHASASPSLTSPRGHVSVSAAGTIITISAAFDHNEQPVAPQAICATTEVGTLSEGTARGAAVGEVLQRSVLRCACQERGVWSFR
jgi:hypothetical protein